MKPKICFVDDDEVLADAYKIYFKSICELKIYSTISCIRDFIRDVENNIVEFQSYKLFILDLFVNGDTGLDAYRCLKNNKIGGKVVFLTGFDNKYNLVKEANSTGELCLLKKDHKLTVEKLKTLITG